MMMLSYDNLVYNIMLPENIYIILLLLLHFHIYIYIIYSGENSGYIIKSCWCIYCIRKLLFVALKIFIVIGLNSFIQNSAFLFDVVYCDIYTLYSKHMYFVYHPVNCVYLYKNVYM